MKWNSNNAILGMGAACVALGLVAATTDGAVRAWSLLLFYLSALGLSFAVSTTARKHDDETRVGGAGYKPPELAKVRYMHVALTVLYNLGIVTVVFAALVRWRIIDLRFPEPLVAAFPLLMGLYMLMLGQASVWRVQEKGGAYADWYTRSHAILLAVVSTPIIVLAFILATSPFVDIGPLRLVQRDLLVFILAGALGIGTQMFLSVRLPTLVELMSAYIRQWTPQKEERTDTPPVVYAAIIALVLTAVIGYVLVQFDVGRAVENRFVDTRITFLVLLLPIGVAAFFVTSALAMYRESRRGFFTRRMTRRLRNDIIVYSTSTALGILFAFMLAWGLTGHASIFGVQLTPNRIKDLTMLTIVATTGPIGLYLQREFKRIDDIEARLSDFLNDLSDARRAGMPLATALQNTANSDYGALTPEVGKMAKQVAWGVPFNDALARMGKRVQSDLVRRAVTLIIEASHTGGSVSDILKAAGRDAYEIKSLERDRRVTMTTYLIVIYVVFFVFMVVIAILDIRFLPQIAAAADSIQEGGLGNSVLQIDQIDQQSMRFIYFNATMVQAIGNGIVGGVLSEGRILSGFRHAALLALVGWAVFRFVLPVL